MFDGDVNNIRQDGAVLEEKTIEIRGSEIPKNVPLLKDRLVHKTSHLCFVPLFVFLLIR